MKPRNRTSEADQFLTLQITLVCDVPNLDAQAAAEELLATMAAEFQLRMMLISDGMPEGETMLRIGFQEPQRRKVKPDDAG